MYKSPMQLFHLSNKHASTSGLRQFAGALENVKGPLLGIDVGTKHIGVAQSDEGRHVAFARFGFRRGTVGDDVRRLERIVRNEGVCGAVVGMPFAPFGRQCEDLQRFIAGYSQAVLRECGVQLVAFWDESCTSAEAKDYVMARSSKTERNDIWGRKRAVDAEAAALILQETLQAMESLKQWERSR